MDHRIIMSCIRGSGYNSRSFRVFCPFKVSLPFEKNSSIPTFVFMPRAFSLVNVEAQFQGWTERNTSDFAMSIGRK